MITFKEFKYVEEPILSPTKTHTLVNPIADKKIKAEAVNKEEKQKKEIDLLKQYGFEIYEQETLQMWIATYFEITFPDWNVIPGFVYNDGYDFTMHNKQKRISLRIEVKTGPLKEYNFVNLFLGVWHLDKQVGLPGYRISQVLSADYVFWTVSTTFGELQKQYDDVHTTVIGVTKKGKLTKDHLVIGRTLGGNTIIYPISTEVFSFEGAQGMDKVVEEIKVLSQNPYS
ncbi:MAG: hypothetical protein QW594_03515 [Candidatus Woesearchaeota archaeon]